jgi:NAD(P)-dependent dehydrogenase (short-subunit alcohol dehydrogenase family)
MTMRFTNKTALVTGGGSSGIGRATALAFAREGASVVVAGRHHASLAYTVELIHADGGDALAVAADVTRDDEAARLIEQTVARYGSLDVAFNNAGVLGTRGAIADLDEDAWSAVWANPTATWLSMKHEIAHMRGHGGGVIVNMASSIGAHMTRPGMGAYAASKAAVSVLTRTAAQEHIGEGIRINAISPGPVDTWMSRLPGETDTDRDARMQSSLPIGRVATTDEIASAVLWLASPESSFAVGHDLVLDGGATA